MSTTILLLNLQPPLRGCVLKLSLNIDWLIFDLQPPLRGCVLKQHGELGEVLRRNAAASARLCVETATAPTKARAFQAAASARLCVETVNILILISVQAAASARLCVETLIVGLTYKVYLRQPPLRGCVLKLTVTRRPKSWIVAAASARLCVETRLPSL